MNMQHENRENICKQSGKAGIAVIYYVFVTINSLTKNVDCYRFDFNNN